MSNYDSYQIFKPCENKHLYNMNKYKQKTTNGYDCCFKPNVINFEKVNKYNLVNPTDKININSYINTVPKYLFYYQLLNMEGYPTFSDNSKTVNGGTIGSSTNGCKFFADYVGDNNYIFKDIIPSTEFNMYTGTSSLFSNLESSKNYNSKIFDNFIDLYKYVNHSQQPLLKFITDTTEENVNLPSYETLNKITCSDSSDTIKYIRYEEYKGSDYHEYLTVCKPSTTNNISLQNTEIDYTLFNFMDDIGNICTSNECDTIEYPSISASYIGNPTGKNDITYDTVEIIGLVLIGCVCLFVIGFLVYKLNNSRIRIKKPKFSDKNSIDQQYIEIKDLLERYKSSPPWVAAVPKIILVIKKE